MYWRLEQICSDHHGFHSRLSDTLNKMIQWWQLSKEAILWSKFSSFNKGDNHFIGENILLYMYPFTLRTLVILIFLPNWSCLLGMLVLLYCYVIGQEMCPIWNLCTSATSTDAMLNYLKSSSCQIYTFHRSISIHKDQIHVIFYRKVVNTFLSTSFNICFGCSKEPFHWDGSFEYQQHVFLGKIRKLNWMEVWKRVFSPQF